MRLKTDDPTFDAIARRLDARLDPTSPRPIAVAFSGGGDSLALLLGSEAWTRRAGRRLIVLTVDHRLRPESGTWAAFCAHRARRLGAEHRALVWDGDKPTSGLSAAARAARHALLAEAAREAGACVILMGHTADDVLEAGAMREAGSTVPSPREWSPSPAWPEGGGVFLLRPMLTIRRAALRAALGSLGEDWIEDPANTDPNSLRATVRMAGGLPQTTEEPSPDVRALHARAEVDWSGQIVIPGPTLLGAEPRAARAFLSAATLCAAGSSRPPRSTQLDLILDRSAGATARVMTLAGARVAIHGAVVRVARDPGRLAMEPVQAPSGRAMPFDGRFEVKAPEDGWRIAAANGRLSCLSRSERNALRAIPPAARRALPLAIDKHGAACCPLLDPAAWGVRNLVKTRLMAACGVIHDEATLSRVGETDREPLNQGGLSEGVVHELA